MKRKLLIYLLCLVGGALPVFIGVTSVWVLIWNGLPYFMIVVLGRVFVCLRPAFFCASLILMVDLAFYIAMQINPRSPYLQLLSIISTLKLLLLLPLVFWFLRNRR